MLFCNIDILDENFTIRRGRYVGVRDGRIACISYTRPDGHWGETYDGRGKLLIPGLVNSHCHAPMTLLRGYGENLTLQDWLNKKIFPFEDKLSDPAVAAGTRLAIAEMLRFGTTSFSEMYFFCQTIGDVVLETGIKCNLSRGLTVFDGSAYESLPAYRDNCDLLARYHGAGDGRLRVDLCIHGEYTTTPAVVDQVAAHAKEAGVGIQVHLSETKAEHEACIERHGMTPAAYFAAHGLFDQPTTAAHCVWLSGDDFDILREKGVTVASCPASNMKLASGFADVRRLRAAGVPVALGTDGAASNNNLNLFKEIYLYALLHKGVTGDPTLITPAEALEAATVAGARAQGRPDCGLIREGARADLVVLDLDTPWATPATDPAANVVYAAQGTDVCLTMVDGKVLYQDGEYKTIDIERVKADVQRATDGILSQL